MIRKLSFVLFLQLLLSNVSAQWCNNLSKPCYKADACFPTNAIKVQDYKFATVNNTYGSATRSVDLYMTVYSSAELPVKIEGGLPVSESGRGNCNKPLIMLIHGGSFRIGCRAYAKDECIEFAKRGYVAATIDYRLGWVPEDIKPACTTFCYTGSCASASKSPCMTTLNDSLEFAAYRAMQDADAAMRFLVHYAESLKIDTNYLYVGGFSAGAITAINLCYINQKEFNIGIPKARVILGVLSKNGNALTDSYKIAGLFNNWGSISDTSFIDGLNNKIPMIAFHGIDDNTVPFSKGQPMSCRNGSYNYTYGSNLIYTRLKNKYPDLPLELYACNGDHGILDGDPATSSQSLYRIQTAICFFKRVRDGDKRQIYVLNKKSEDSTAYEQLEQLLPLNCSYVNSNKNTTLNENIANIKSTNAYKPTVTVYPNPVKNVLHIQTMSKITITLSGASGKQLLKKTVSGDESLDVSQLEAGLYFLNITETGMQQKIIILR